MTNEVSLQNDDIRNKFRTLYLEGKEYKEINEILGISQGTFDSAYWRNTQGLRDWIQEIKKERVMQTVERFSKDLMAQEAKNERIKAIQQKEAEFLRETLLKDQGYTKRVETLGFNLNKNEPLDDSQKKNLDKILKTTHNHIKNAEYENVTIPENPLNKPLNEEMQA